MLCYVIESPTSAFILFYYDFPIASSFSVVSVVSTSSPNKDTKVSLFSDGIDTLVATVKSNTAGYTFG